MFYITAFIATQEQVKPELKNEKSDTIAQGRQVKTSNPAKAAAMQNAHFASVSEQPAYDGQCIAGRRMARRAWPASVWSTSINREKILGPERKAWSKWKDWENGHDGIEKKDASNDLMTWGFANGVFKPSQNIAALALHERQTALFKRRTACEIPHIKPF